MKNCICIHENVSILFLHSLCNFILLNVRSLANARLARQFNPLNPPGVGWVDFFFKVLSAHACQIWARSVAKDF